MAQYCKLKGLILIWLITYCQPFFCENRKIEAIKILNKSKTKILCRHAIPENTVAYIHLLSTEFPRAYITNSNRATHGNHPRAQKQDRINPLPTYVRIRFDREVSQIFVDNFFSTLKSLHHAFRGIYPIRHKKFRDEFVFRVGSHYTLTELETLIEKTNISMFKKKSAEILAGVRNYV